MNKITYLTSLNINPEKTCAFTGPRPQNLPWGFFDESKECLALKKELKSIIISLQKNGIENFIVGMAMGFDMIVADVLLEIKKEKNNPKIFAVIPCKDQCDLWPKSMQEKYNIILKKLNGVYSVSEKYEGSFCMIKRNQIMVDSSAVLVAYLGAFSSGTKSTINYAKKKHKQILYVS